MTSASGVGVALHLWSNVRVKIKINPVDESFCLSRYTEHFPRLCHFNAEDKQCNNLKMWLCILLIQGKTEEQIKAEKAWYQTEKVWLVHKDGFSMGENKPMLLNLCIKALCLCICEVNSTVCAASAALWEALFKFLKHSGAPMRRRLKKLLWILEHLTRLLNAAGRLILTPLAFIVVCFPLYNLCLLSCT